MPTSIYPLDPTGTNPNNLVTNDIFDVTPGANTAIVPSEGIYFADSLIVKDNSTNALLTRDIDYLCIELNGEMTGKYGQELCNAILFLGESLATSVNLTYQCLGSVSGAELPQMQALLQNVLGTSAQVEWFNILNKPLLYQPNNHINMLSDIYGFEPVVYAIERLTDILKLNRVGNNQLIMNFIQEKLSGFCYQMNMVQYTMVGFSTITITPQINNQSVINQLSYDHVANGLTMNWTLSNNIADISSSYYPAQGVVGADNYGQTPQQGQVSFNAAEGIIPGTVFTLSLPSPCLSAQENVLSWYTYTNGFPNPSSKEYSLSYVESDRYPIIPPTTSKTFRKAFNIDRAYNPG